jgi:hypothetical protein
MAAFPQDLPIKPVDLLNTGFGHFDMPGQGRQRRSYLKITSSISGLIPRIIRVSSSWV